MNHVVRKPLLIKGATTITVDSDNRVGHFDIYIDANGAISNVRENIEPQLGDELMDGRGCIAMPGLVQTHVHLCQTLFRGVADDVELLDFLRRYIWPLEGALTERDVYASARLGILELLLGGTTTILDMGTVHHTDSLFTAARDMGIRYTGGKTIMDQGQGFPAALRETTEQALTESARLCDAWHGQDQGLLRYAFSPRFALSCSDQVMKHCAIAARMRGTLMHTHAAENSEEVQLVRDRTGLGNIEYLQKLGWTGPDVVLAHCVWLSSNERKILRETKTVVAHCPSANLKLGSGIARVGELLADDVVVTVGSNSAASNNRLDGFEEMRLLALLHKAREGAGAIPARQALRLCTRGAAKALGYEHVGSIAEGFRADIVLLDRMRPHLRPCTGDPVSAVVYAARASDVHTVIVDGIVRVRDGALCSPVLDSILTDAEEAAAAVIQRA